MPPLAHFFLGEPIIPESPAPSRAWGCTLLMLTGAEPRTKNRESTRVNFVSLQALIYAYAPLSLISASRPVSAHLRTGALTAHLRGRALLSFARCAADTGMMNALLSTQDGARELLAIFLTGRSPRTLDAYRADLKRFSEFIGVQHVAQAAKHLLALTHGEANALVLHYCAALIQSGLAPATTNRRLAALRSLVQLACFLGLVPWRLPVPGVEATPYRDTRGPGKEGYQRLLAVLEGAKSAKARRDRRRAPPRFTACGDHSGPRSYRRQRAHRPTFLPPSRSAHPDSLRRQPPGPWRRDRLSLSGISVLQCALWDPLPSPGSTSSHPVSAIRMATAYSGASPGDHRAEVVPEQRRNLAQQTSS